MGVPFSKEENDKVYRDTQKQRAYERAIRQSKRELAALDASRSAASDDDALKQKLDREFQRKAVVLKRREAKLAEHLKASGLLPDNSRVRVDGFGRSVSGKAVWANKNELDKAKLNGIIKEIKELGISGEIHIPAKKINIDLLTFDSNHISERGHNVSIEEAKSFILNAKFSAERWKGQFLNFYSDIGAAYVNLETNEIRTAFSKDEFSENILEALEVLKQNGR